MFAVAEEDLDEAEYEFEDEREFVSDISGESDDGLSDLEEAVVSFFIKPSGYWLIRTLGGR